MTAEFCECPEHDRTTEILPSRIWGCGRCKKPLDYSNSVQSTGTQDSAPSRRTTEAHKRTNSKTIKNWEHTVVESLIRQLTETEKYNRAINQGAFATFSIIGTNDWEDYASLSFQALQLKGMVRLEEAIAKQNELLSTLIETLNKPTFSANLNSTNPADQNVMSSPKNND